MKQLFLNKWLIKSLVWQNFSLFFDAIESEKYLGYEMVMQYVKFAIYVKLAVCTGMTGPNMGQHI